MSTRGRPKNRPGKAPGLLSETDLKFVDKYVETLSPGKAYSYALDYQGPLAAKQGHKLLQRPAIQAAIEVRRMQAAGEANVTPARVMARAALIAFADLRMMFDDEGKVKDIKNLPDEIGLALRSVKVLKTTRASANDVSITFQILQYSLRDSDAMLKWLGEAVGVGKLKGPEGYENMSVEELERVYQANEEACRAIEGARQRATTIMQKAVAKASAKILAEDAKEAAPKKNGANGSAKPNGKGKPNGNGSNGSGTRH